MEVYHLWIIAGILLLVAEIFTPGFIIGSFGLSCFAAAIAAFMGFGAATQLLAFSIATLVVFFGVRPAYKRFFMRLDDPARVGVERLIGETAIVSEAIDNLQNAGRIKAGGEFWKAASLEGNSIPEGATVIIQKIEGVTAYVIQQTAGE